MHKIQSAFFSKMDNTYNTNETAPDKIIYKGVKTIEDINNTKMNKNGYNRGLIMKDLIVLRQFADLPIQSLQKDTLDKFYQIIKINDNLKKDENLRKTFLKDVKKVFSDIQNIKPGTVGAVFLDCSNNLDCDPICEKSIFKKEKQCDHVILLYTTEDSTFKSLNDILNSNIIYIYVDVIKSKFKGFTKENIDFLKNNYNSKGYVLLFSDFDKTKDEIPIPLDMLPTLNQVKNMNNIVNNNLNKTCKQNINPYYNTMTNKDIQIQQQENVNMNNVFIVLFILLFILIIIGAVLYAYQEENIKYIY